MPHSLAVWVGLVWVGSKCGDRHFLFNTHFKKMRRRAVASQSDTKSFGLDDTDTALAPRNATTTLYLICQWD